MLAEPQTITASTDPANGVPVDFLVDFIESDPLLTDEDRAWFRDLLGTQPRPA